MYEERRRRFLEAMGSNAVALFLGAQPATRSADTEYPFRQESDFHYLTGFDHPNASAVLSTREGPDFLLFVEPHDAQAEIWTGFRPGVEGAVRDFGANEAHPCKKFLEKLPGLIEGARRLFHVLGRNASVDAKLLESLEGMRLRSRLGMVPPEAVEDPRSIVHEMRLVKSADEIEIMRRAAAISAEAHREAALIAHEGRFEFELAAVLDYTFRRRGSAGPAYSSIVGGGKNATILHYIANDQKLRQGELVLIDAGCELEGYASDVTRTYPVGGRFLGEGKAVYEAVLAAQEAAIEATAPGITLEALHDIALRKIVEGLVDLEILEGSVDGLIESEAYRPYYMHRTSHWLGLDVHDVGAYTLDGEPRPLGPGMVITVEPGIYLSDKDDKLNPGFQGIGVRIEDDVAVTNDGFENLTAAIPKHPSDVEAWMAE